MRPNRLAELRKRAGLSMRALAERAGVDPSSLNKWEKGQRDLRSTPLRKLADALGVDPGEILSEGVVSGRNFQARPRTPASIESEGRMGDLVDFRGVRYAAIKRLDLAAAAGHGFVGEDEGHGRKAPELDPLLFRLDWVQQVAPHSRLEDLYVIEIDGDSMEPTLRPGDHILVDTGTQRGRDGIHVIAIGDDLVVKRITRHPRHGLLTISSDNANYARYDDLSPDEIHVVGRVVWLGRRV